MSKKGKRNIQGVISTDEEAQNTSATTKKQKIERTDDYQCSQEGTYTAILVVEDEKLYIVKEVLQSNSNRHCISRKVQRNLEI